MGTRWSRFARGWVVAGFSLFVAALSHTLGGGAAPGVLAVVVSLAFSGIVCIGLSARALSLWRVSLSVLASQLIFHGLFSLGAPGGTLATDAAGTHDHAAAGLGLAEFGPTSFGPVATAPAGLGLAAAGPAGPHPVDEHGALMWLAHGIAAVVTILALRHGERAFWGLLAGARIVIRSLFEPAAAASMPSAPRRTRATAPVFMPRDLGVLLSARRHRGPPLCPRAA